MPDPSLKQPPHLILYHFAGCPYCARVHNFLKQHGLQIPLKDIHQDPTAYAELQATGGKIQVPCLFIDGQPLYESLDIIDWLKKNINLTSSK